VIYQMDASLFFNVPNFIYWLALALVVLAESRLVGERWSESRRWRLGYVTLFGSSLVMVAWFGWHWATWAGLLAACGMSRLLKVERPLVGDLWTRKEAHRWTAQYFIAFVLCIPFVVWGQWDMSTWGALFFALGVCGATKLAWEAIRDARRARQLRATRAMAEGVVDERTGR
jgi:hypothetical protein